MVALHRIGNMNTNPLRIDSPSPDSLTLINPEFRALGQRLIDSADILSVNLIPLRTSESVASLRKIFPIGPLCACDFHVDGAETWQRVSGGFLSERDGILNMDHHAEHPDMYRFISSGNLAAAQVRESGPTDHQVIVSHLDCDSVVTGLTITGDIPPHPIFEQAVIAADHTGREHPIADLLQALDGIRNFSFSKRNLGLLLAGHPLEPDAQKLLDHRHDSRKATEALIARGNIETFGKLAVVQMDGKMRNEFLPALLPDAAIILTFEPGSKSVEDRDIARLRLGNGAPEGFSIFDLKLKEFDPGYGGRWNAGSNKRGGGCLIPKGEYTRLLTVALERALQDF